MYEFVFTFDKEVELFWRRKFTLSSVLFLLNRYVPLVVNMILAPWASLPTTSAVRLLQQVFDPCLANAYCRGKIPTLIQPEPPSKSTCNAAVKH